MKPMKILSYNVRAWMKDLKIKSPWNWHLRMEFIKSFIEEQDPDIICFQELIFPATKYIPRQYERIGFSLSHPIYTKKNIEVSKYKNHPFFSIIEIGENIIVNAHFLTDFGIFKKRKRSLQEVVKTVRSRTLSTAIFCCSHDNILNKHPKNSIIVPNNLWWIDSCIWKLRKNKNYTYCDLKTGIEEDFDDFFIFGYSGQVIKKVQVFPVEGLSDHYPIILTIDL